MVNGINNIQKVGINTRVDSSVLCIAPFLREKYEKCVMYSCLQHLRVHGFAMEVAGFVLVYL